MSFLSHHISLSSPRHIYLPLMRLKRSPIKGGSWNDRRTNGVKSLQFGVLSFGWMDFGAQRCQLSVHLDGGFKYFLFPPLPGEMIQFDE